MFIKCGANFNLFTETHRNSPNLTETPQNSPKLTTETSKNHRNSPKLPETHPSHDGLLDDPKTNSDTNDEGSHDGLLDDPKTNSDTNDEGVREGCNVADGQPLLYNDFMNLERLTSCLAEN
ncbi:hypothetical protein PoB_004382600 [Plakobranchus ocellatus]|uniref:Uncharacterized protein n=1 Tax=Plakobranchus ocellatus TaxID=259542 RepID=A0AAV4B1S8_9GAST|nr:hypothetical protein PoB_004382600 [Plakobranchus ocellatus]